MPGRPESSRWIARGESRFATTDRLARLEGRVAKIENRIAFDRMDALFARQRRENRLVFLFYVTMLGFLVALFRLGVI